MLLLATDTSGKHGSIALAQGNAEGSCDVIELVPLAGGTFSAQLVPQIAALLSKHGFGKQDLHGFAVASGPGSFTGLRVGLAAIKGLAETMNKPIVAISLLEALAHASPTERTVIAALDAGRGEIYAGRYELGQPKALWERLLSEEEYLAETCFGMTITPDARIAGLARAAGREVQPVERPRSDAIARLGWPKLLRGETVSPEELEANYLRRSDAEIFSKNPG